ncbi:MAG TPA: sigma 54-interacting transcriptional regulator [Polyangiaceae bacterium]|nr:sigma 54-interacting transcriptional regulator [Polyangiaceae bacterium]
MPEGNPEKTAVDASGLAGSAAYLPSATAWRWVAEHRCAVSIDVTLGKVMPHMSGAPVVIQNNEVIAGRRIRSGAPMAAGQIQSQETVQRLLDRAATHLYVLPLRGPAGTVDGMISLEAECRAAIGQEFIWSECGVLLQVMADVAAPHLSALPQSAAATVEPDEFLPVVGASMAGLLQMVRVFAEQNETILIGGPTGVGKSRLALFCHARSPRSSHRFESLDLMTVPEDLQMGELFGWKKGAFSGAVADSQGSIARAERGTLFIDEIDKLSLKAQAGLLHVLEERRYRPLGDGSGERRADVRFIIGTNANLHAAVRAGRFREDLYYRINVLPIKLPPLDERRDEIPLWAQYMVRRRHHDAAPGGRASVSPLAESLLLATRWPGNLRQLDNIIRRAYAISLMDYGKVPSEVRLQEHHIKRALAYEGAPESASSAEAASLVELLQRAAAAFVSEAERRPADRPLDLDLADALRGFVVGEAVRRLGSKEKAFKLLGKDVIISNRNQKKAFKREVDKALALCRALGTEEPGPLADVLEGDEKET